MVNEHKDDLKENAKVPNTLVYEIPPSRPLCALLKLIASAMEEIELRIQAKDKKKEQEKVEAGEQRKILRGSTEYDNNCNNEVCESKI